MMTDKELSERSKRLGEAFASAVAKAAAAAGAQKKLAEITGIHQSRISDYANGRYDFSKLTVGTLLRLFPDLEIAYNGGDGGENVWKEDEMGAEIERRILILFRRLPRESKLLWYESLVKLCCDTPSVSAFEAGKTAREISSPERPEGAACN